MVIFWIICSRSRPMQRVVPGITVDLPNYYGYCSSRMKARLRRPEPSRRTQNGLTASLMKCLVAALLLFSGLATPGAAIKRISAGGFADLLLKSDGSLWANGFEYRTPTLLASNGVVSIAAGFQHGFFIDSDGNLWAIGDNSHGQLGDGTLVPTSTPKKVISGGVVAAAAGFLHSFFIKSDGSLWGMGWNTSGQLGDGTTNDQHFPVQIVPGGVSDVAASGTYSAFVKVDGSLWTMGSSPNGGLGNGAIILTNIPQQIIPGGVTAVATERGNQHCLILKSDGSLWGMGANGSGELGDGTRTDRLTPVQIVAGGVRAIAAGFIHSLFLKSDGSLWGMGDDEYGQLGMGYGNSPFKVVPVLITTNVLNISCGHYVSFLQKPDNSIWGMGANVGGQLGSQAGDEVHTPILIYPGTHVSDFSTSGNNLRLGVTNGVLGGKYIVRTSSDVSLPPDQWTPVTTNVPTADDYFTITATNVVSPGVSQRFFNLQLP